MLDTQCGPAQALVFDVDGTLYPHQRAVGLSYDASLANMIKDLCAVDGGGDARCLDPTDLTNEHVVLTLSRVSGRPVSDILHLIYDGVDISGLLPDVEVLEELQRVAGHATLAIMSNAPTFHVRRVLDALNLDDLPWCIVGLDTLHFEQKPALPAYWKMLDRLCVSARHVVFLDDSPANIEAARSTELRTVLVRGYEPKSPHSMRFESELPGQSSTTILQFLRSCTPSKRNPAADDH